MIYDLLIPAYNAEKTIPELLRQINEMGCPPLNLIVVDDGSSDHTFSILQQNVEHCLRHEKNTGKGSALQHGLNYALTNSSAPVVICIDSDLQHLPEQIPAFLEKYEKDGIELIIGNRIGRKKVMPIERRISNFLTSKLLSFFTSQSLPDSQCGFRLVSKNLLSRVNISNTGFQFESQFILETARLGFKIGFVNIPTIYNNHRSNIHHLRDTIGFIKLILVEIRRRL
jgi:glycosyltransferase involved in cell wall biosynthesis